MSGAKGHIEIGNPIHASLIAGAAGAIFNPTADVVIARVDDDGSLMGGVVYSDFTGEGGSIGIHVASWDKDWINRDMLWVTFDYPFTRLKCKKLFGFVRSDNKQALDFDLNVGFKVDTVIADAYPDADLYVVSMYADECRWLRLKPRGEFKVWRAPDGQEV